MGKIKNPQQSDQALLDEVLALREEKLLLKEDYSVLLEKYNHLHDENRALRDKVDHLIRILSRSKSEKLDPDQLELLLEGAGVTPAQQPADEPPEEETDALTNATPQRSTKGKRRARIQLPPNLPSEEIELIPEEVKANPESFVRIGEKRTEKLDVTPTSYRRLVYVRPTYAPKEPGKKWTTAQVPGQLLEKSVLTPSLLAHTLTAKFNDHLPFYRQSQIMERRYGIKISRKTLCEWADLAAELAEPLWKLIAQCLRESHFVQVDETPVSYLPSDQLGSKEGRFWVYRNAAGLLLYDWHTSRSHECLFKILGDPSIQQPQANGQHFKGHLQCDGYSAYRTYAGKSHEEIKLNGCWAHVRRKFFEAKGDDLRALKPLQMIQKIYADERQLKELLEGKGHPPGAITHLRRRRKWHRKHLQPLKEHLLELQKDLLPTSKLGRAVSYCLNQWQEHCQAVKSSPHLDNNHVENAVRPLKLGAKNWLFIGNEDTGWRSAVIYTLIENVRSLGRDPFEYLKWYYERITTMTNQDDLSELLPSQWVKAHPPTWDRLASLPLPVPA